MNELKYRPDIDGLRALAVAMVMLYHAGLGVPGGFIGVDVFFVISGYLITGLILNQQRAGTFSLVSFYVRRIRRIIPAAVVMTTACLFAGYFLLFPAEYKELARSAIAQQFMASNVFFEMTISYFNAGTERKPLLHTWSLAVEEQFYLIYPVFLVALARFSTRVKGGVIGVLLLGSLALSEWQVSSNPEQAFYLLPARAWELLLGGWLWFVPRPLTRRPRIVDQALSLAGLTLILVVAFQFEKSSQFPGLAALWPCGGAALLIFSNAQRLTWVGHALACKPMVGLGLISYSLYLWHWPLLAFANSWYLEALPTSSSTLILAISLILAWFSWRYVETPLRRAGTFKHPAWVLAGIAASVTVLLLCSAIIERGQGLPGRLPHKALVYLGVKKQSKARFWAEQSTIQVQKGELPTHGDLGGTRTCLIWGDSHAKHLIPPLEIASQSHGVRLIQVTHSVTAPLLDIVYNTEFGLREASPEYNRAVVEYAIANRADLVIMSGVWSYYAKNDRFESSLRETIEALHAGGVTPVIFLDIAGFKAEVPLVMARNCWFGLPTDTQKTTLAVRNAQNREADTIIRRTAHGKAIVLDPAPYFVTKDNIWLGEIDGQALYYDQSHLSTAGSLRLVPMFEDLFETLGRDHAQPR